MQSRLSAVGYRRAVSTRKPLNRAMLETGSHELVSSVEVNDESAQVKDINSMASTGVMDEFSVDDVIFLQASRQQCQAEGADNFLCCAAKVSE